MASDVDDKSKRFQIRLTQIQIWASVFIAVGSALLFGAFISSLYTGASSIVQSSTTQGGSAGASTFGASLIASAPYFLALGIVMIVGSAIIFTILATRTYGKPDTNEPTSLQGKSKRLIILVVLIVSGATLIVAYVSLNVPSNSADDQLESRLQDLEKKIADLQQAINAINDKIDSSGDESDTEDSNAKSEPARKLILAVIGARIDEIRPILRQMNDIGGEVIGGRTFYVGEIYGKNILVVSSGRGKVNAAITTQLLIKHFEPKGIIFTGIAGALTNHTSKQFSVGDVVIGSKTFYHDWRKINGTNIQRDPHTALIINDEVVRIPYNKQLDDFLVPMSAVCYNDDEKSFLPDSDLYALALVVMSRPITLEGTNTKIMTDFIVTGDQLVSSKNESDWIHKNFFRANVTEMEGAAVAHVACANNATPHLIIRGISDPAYDAEESKKIREEKRELAIKNSATITLEVIRLWT